MSFDTRWPERTLRDHAGHFPSSVGDLTLPESGVALKVHAVAVVNAGRWIARCPDPDCGGAEYVNLDDPVLFCCECRNARYRHHPVKVKVPKPDDRAQVEALLLARPVPGTRNWEPGETIDQLVAENEAHGLEAG